MLLKIILINMLLGIGAYALTGEELQKQGIDGNLKYGEDARRTGSYNKNTIDKAFKDLTLSIEVLNKEKKFEKKNLSLVSLASNYRIKSQYKEAYIEYIKALEIAQKNNYIENEVRALFGMARVEITYFLKYEKAETHLNEALEAVKKIDNELLRVRLLYYKSQTQIKQKRLIPALVTLNKAIVLGKRLDSRDLYYLYLSLGEVHLSMSETCNNTTYDVEYFKTCRKELELSKLNYEKSLDIAKEFHWNRDVSLFTMTLTVYLPFISSKLDMLERHAKMYTIANFFKPKSEKDVILSENFSSFNENFLTKKDQQILLEIDNHTKDMAKKNMQIIKKDSSYFSGKADIVRLEGDMQKYLTYALEAVNVLEKERLDFSDVEKRSKYLHNKMGIYYQPLLYLLDLNKTSDAFDLLERSLASGLKDLLNSKISFKSQKEKEGFLKLMNISNEIKRLEVEFYDEVESSSDKKKPLKRFSELEKTYNDILKNIEKNLPKLQNLLTSPVSTLEEVQKSIKEDKYEIIEYLVQQNQLIIWHIKEDKVNVKSVFLPQTELVKKVKSIGKTLKGKNKKFAFDVNSSKELFLYLIQPILKDIKSKHLVIIPHNELNQLPFQSLMNPKNNEFLGETYQISYVPSASVLMNLNRIKNFKDRKILAIGNPTMSSGGIKEINTIASIYPRNTTKVIDHLITKEELSKKIKGHSIVHLSVHGKYVTSSPMLSHLKLAPKEGNKGFLTASDMFGLPLERNSLVVLSACETAKVQATQSNETLGIVRGLLYAGADALVLSFWKVDEEATALWMETFYRVAKTESLVEASRQAIIKVKNTSKYSHPHYWAGFSVIGK